MVNDNGGNDAGSVTVLQESLDSVRAVGRVHHTEAANITDIRVPGRRRSKAVPLELSDYGCQVARFEVIPSPKKCFQLQIELTDPTCDWTIQVTGYWFLDMPLFQHNHHLEFFLYSDHRKLDQVEQWHRQLDFRLYDI